MRSPRHRRASSSLRGREGRGAATHACASAFQRLRRTGSGPSGELRSRPSPQRGRGRWSRFTFRRSLRAIGHPPPTPTTTTPDTPIHPDYEAEHALSRHTRRPRVAREEISQQRLLGRSSDMLSSSSSRKRLAGACELRSSSTLMWPASGRRPAHAGRTAACALGVGAHEARRRRSADVAFRDLGEAQELQGFGNRTGRRSHMQVVGERRHVARPL